MLAHPSLRTRGTVSIDFIRQTGWDLWVWVCVAASLVLLSYAILTRRATGTRSRLTLILSLAGIAGTTVVLATPPLHSPMVGVVWTFLLLSLLSTAFYLNLRRQLSFVRTTTLLTIRVAAL